MNDTEGSEEQADDEDEEPSGKIMINPLRDLGAISGFTISDVPGIKVNEKEFHLAPGTNSKIFALEELDSGATIVLVYTHVDRKPTIWLYTKEKKFYFLAKHFIRYLRMAVAYWGIPDWQFVFTKQEVSEMTLVSNVLFGIRCTIHLIFNYFIKQELLQVFVPHILSMTERYDVISSNITKLSKSDEDFVAALLNENDSDSICDDDFPDTPVNEIDSDFFLHATNPQTAAPNSVVDMTASTSNKVEKKTPTAKSRLTPTKFKRKPLYYIKQRPQ